MDELLQKFEKKARYNLKSAFQKITALRPQVKHITAYKDFLYWFKIFRELSMRRFEKDADHSTFKDEREVESFLYFFKNGGGSQTKFIVVTIDGHIAAIDLNILYKDCYYLVNGVNDLSRFPGIGMFMVYTEFEDAIRLGLKKVDCFQEDHGWKHRYFETHPLLKLVKK